MNVISQDTGIAYDLQVNTVVDACGKCGGSGGYRYSTFADLREAVARRTAYYESDNDDDESWYPEKSASCECDRCHGTGVVKGEGEVHRFTMTMSYSIGTLP